MPYPVFTTQHLFDQHLIAEVLAELALHGGAILRIARACGFGSSEVRRQISAGMRGADTQRRELVERPVEDEMREKHGRLERVADRIAQPASSAQTGILCGTGSVAGMHEHQRAELLRLRPERIEFRQRQLLAFHAAADGGAPQPELPDPVSELLGREVRKMQRHRREPDVSIGMRRTPRRELLVLDLDNLARELAVRRVPERVDAEDLDIDPLRVQRMETLGAEDETAAVGLVAAAGRRELRTFENIADLGHREGTVDVDRLDPLGAADA